MIILVIIQNIEHLSQMNLVLVNYMSIKLIKITLVKYFYIEMINRYIVMQLVCVNSYYLKKKLETSGLGECSVGKSAGLSKHEDLQSGP